jgi:hypothetical protein
MSTSLLTQYLKQRSGHILNLQQIFTPATAFDPENTQLCVICQTSSISHTILPCRHACVCGLCFERIDKCPLCRSSINSFFKIRDDEDIDLDEDFDEENDRMTNQSNSGWFSRINAKLKQRFGIN